MLRRERGEEMNWFFGFAVYFIIWWMSLFLVLPFFGARSQQQAGEKVLGTVASAPARHRTWKVFGVTTLVAMVVFVGWYFVSIYFGFTFDSIPQFYPDYRPN